MGFIIFIFILICIFVPELLLLLFMFFALFFEFILRLFGKSLDDKDDKKKE